MSGAYICDFARTPFGKYGGALATIRADDLAAIPLRALAERSSFDKAAIDDVILGCANQAGEDNRNVARLALLLAGLPVSVPGVTVNRLCASGLEAIAQGARAIVSGEADLILAGGAESMTRAPYVMGKSEVPFGRTAKLEDTTMGWRFVNPRMQKEYGVDSMPQTAENIAREFQISRADQDSFAFRSQQRAAAAKARDFFSGEIVPAELPHSRTGQTIVSDDEHPRPETSLSTLSQLRPVTSPSGTVTAGNASGINDGAAALLLASETAITDHALRPRARILGYATIGVEPRVMGMGPVPAVSRLLARLGLLLRDFDVIEINEAFAAQCLAVLRGLGLEDDVPHVNPNGGAIAFGHPLGASGARLAITAARSLEERGARRALVTLCVGVGQGVAMAIERV